MPGISTALRGTALLVSFYYAGLRALDRLPLLLRNPDELRRESGGQSADAARGGGRAAGDGDTTVLRLTLD